MNRSGASPRHYDYRTCGLLLPKVSSHGLQRADSESRGATRREKGRD
jgi:hypothetical protein